MASFCVTLFDSLENAADGDNCFATATKNFTINQGSSYRITFVLSKNGDPAILTGFTLRGQIRPSVNSNIVLLDMSSSNLLLRVNHDRSAIEMVLPETFTRRVTNTYAVYDVEMVSVGGDVSRIVQGLITFVPEVTR